MTTPTSQGDLRGGCTAGGDCPVHPWIGGIHDPNFMAAYDEVQAAARRKPPELGDDEILDRAVAVGRRYDQWGVAGDAKAMMHATAREALRLAREQVQRELDDARA